MVIVLKLIALAMSRQDACSSKVSEAGGHGGAKQVQEGPQLWLACPANPGFSCSAYRAGHPCMPCLTCGSCGGQRCALTVLALADSERVPGAPQSGPFAKLA